MKNNETTKIYTNFKNYLSSKECYIRLIMKMEITKNETRSKHFFKVYERLTKMYKRDYDRQVNQLEIKANVNNINVA